MFGFEPLSESVWKPGTEMFVNKRGFADAMFLSVTNALDLKNASVGERKLKRGFWASVPNENNKRNRKEKRQTNETLEYF